jgi:hypothetical protein
MANLSDLIESNKNGWMPVGTVIPVMGSITGAIAIPASGTVVDGMMYCDGTAIPGGQTLSGNTPAINGDVFLQGSSIAGATGGANTIALSHVHNMQHIHQTASQVVSGFESRMYSYTSASNAYAQTATYAGQPTGTLLAGGELGFTGTTASGTRTTPLLASGATVRFTANTLDNGGTSKSDTGSGGSAAQDNRPSYITVQYLIRVK